MRGGREERREAKEREIRGEEEDGRGKKRYKGRMKGEGR